MKKVKYSLRIDEKKLPLKVISIFVLLLTACIALKKHLK